MQNVAPPIVKTTRRRKVTQFEEDALKVIFINLEAHLLLRDARNQLLRDLLTFEAFSRLSRDQVYNVYMAFSNEALLRYHAGPTLRDLTAKFCSTEAGGFLDNHIWNILIDWYESFVDIHPVLGVPDGLVAFFELVKVISARKEASTDGVCQLKTPDSLDTLPQEC